MMQKPAMLAAAWILAAFSMAGCGTRLVKTPVVDTNSLKVTLRHQLQNGTVVDRAFQHPPTISSQRLSNILGAIDIEMREDGTRKKRMAAIHPELLKPLSRAMVDAFEKADSSQEVAVIAVRKQQRLGIFHKKYLTTLTAFFRDERLYLHLSRVEWEIPRDRENKTMPEPERGEKQMAFRTVPMRKMNQAGSQGVAVRWHDNLFSAPVRTASDVGGDRQERTILMESPIPVDEVDDRVRIQGIEPETLRALADLEEARRSGSLTETEYEQRREDLLDEGGF